MWSAPAGRARLAWRSSWPPGWSTRFQSGARLSDLSPLTDASLVASTVAAVFAVRDAPGGNPLDARRRGRSKAADVLLLVDNCEHLLESAAADDGFCGSPPGSRAGHQPRATRRGRRAGVAHWAPASPGSGAGVDAIAGSDAVRLFANRGSLARVGFEVTAHNAAAVADICQRLDGLPLAIELVAAQVATLPPTVIAERLADHPQVLGPGPSRRQGRHRTLEAAIEWSYQLLDDDQRVVAFSVVSLTASRSTRPASVGVSDDPVSVLSSLVDKSLVLWDPDPDRYRLLETIRHFARARLDQAGEGDIAAARHLGWCLEIRRIAWQLLERARRTWGGLPLIKPGARQLPGRLGWAVRHKRTEAVRLATPLGAYWGYGLRSATVEIRTGWDGSPNSGSSPVDTGTALSWAAMISIRIDDNRTALADSEHAVDMLRSGGDARGPCPSVDKPRRNPRCHGTRRRARPVARATRPTAARGDTFELVRMPSTTSAIGKPNGVTWTLPSPTGGQLSNRRPITPHPPSEQSYGTSLRPSSNKIGLQGWRST